MSDAQHEIGDDHEQRDEKERDGGTGGKIAPLNAEGEGEGRERLRRVKRAAGREDVHDGHVREGEDEAEEDGDAEDRPHHGHDDLELGAPETSPVDRGGFRDVLGDGGAPGEKDYGGEGHKAPTMDEQDGSDGEMGFAEPHGSVERFVEVQRHQNPTDDAVDGVQKPFPSDSAEGDRRDPREEDQKTNEAAAAKGLLQGNGQDIGANNHQDLRTDGEDQGIADGNAKAGTVQDAAKIFQANKMHFGIADAGVAESIKNGEEKRTGDEQKDVQHSGREHRGA